MAAHILRFIMQELVQDETEQMFELFKHALENAPCGDDLDHSDWSKLWNCETWTEAKNILSVLRGKYTAIWIVLGRPNTQEAWETKKFILYEKRGQEGSVYWQYMNLLISSYYDWLTGDI